MTDPDPEVALLRSQIEDLEWALAALRDGAVDALVGGRADPGLHATADADRPYRVIVEGMGQGAATVTTDGVLLFANPQLSAMLGLDGQHLVGRDLAGLVQPTSRPELDRLLDVDLDGTHRGELAFVGAETEVPALVAATALDIDGQPLRCLVVTDLTAQRELERRQAEQVVLEKSRAERARIAREVNDGIVQGLVAAETAFDLGQVVRAREALAQTSHRARAWIGELVEGGVLEAGMAVQTGPLGPNAGTAS